MGMAHRPDLSRVEACSLLKWLLHAQDTWGNAVGELQAGWNASVGGSLQAPGLLEGNITVLQQQDALGALVVFTQQFVVNLRTCSLCRMTSHAAKCC